MALLSEQRKQILTEKRVELVEGIELDGLWSHLRSRRIVTEEDEARIKFNGSFFKQIGELLDHLAKRTESDFEAFCECLVANSQEHIATDILCYRTYSAQSPSNKVIYYENATLFKVRFRPVFTTKLSKFTPTFQAVYKPNHLSIGNQRILTERSEGQDAISEYWRSEVCREQRTGKQAHSSLSDSKYLEGTDLLHFLLETQAAPQHIRHEYLP
ncbi:hypothetical protein CAPTEDRAFT_208910 [Capitella teleta]|uniref:CARD domain-containing protein n=1 Tax=Capitella teleta TaxID=283909 RepID=R7UFV1_CAPTE|nr:hypothetical protein CAPTEDRAFT_208910 [Capitella teleta]|eukprot:ELU04978.1 hypothetical protein CAPTEDRAFT_208910 [Capitella teleta]